MQETLTPTRTKNLEESNLSPENKRSEWIDNLNLHGNPKEVEEKRGLLENGGSLTFWGDIPPEGAVDMDKATVVNYEDLCALVRQELGSRANSPDFDEEFAVLLNIMSAPAPVILEMRPEQFAHATDWQRRNFTTGEMMYGEAWMSRLNDLLGLRARAWRSQESGDETAKRLAHAQAWVQIRPPLNQKEYSEKTEPAHRQDDWKAAA